MYVQNLDTLQETVPTLMAEMTEGEIVEAEMEVAETEVAETEVAEMEVAGIATEVEMVVEIHTEVEETEIHTEVEETEIHTEVEVVGVTEILITAEEVEEMILVSIVEDEGIIQENVDRVEMEVEGVDKEEDEEEKEVVPATVTDVVNKDIWQEIVMMTAHPAITAKNLDIWQKIVQKKQDAKNAIRPAICQGNAQILNTGTAVGIENVTHVENLDIKHGIVGMVVVAMVPAVRENATSVENLDIKHVIVGTMITVIVINSA